MIHENAQRRGRKMLEQQQAELREAGTRNKAIRYTR